MGLCTIAIQVEERYNQEAGLQAHALRRAVRATLDHECVEDGGEVTVVVTKDSVLRELNRRHRGLDTETDVLAFPNETRGPFVDAPGLPCYLGDIVISFPRARVQATKAGNELLAELQLLVVHGVLHLLGYDDQTESERARMWKAQREILDELGAEVRLQLAADGTSELD